MNQFLFERGRATELQLFPHIVEIGLRKNTSIQLDSFLESTADCMRIYYAIDGKFEWLVSGRPVTIFPTDVVYVLPGERIGGASGFLDMGTLTWIHLDIEQNGKGSTLPGSWSAMCENESQAIRSIMNIHRSAHLPLLSGAGRIFQQLQLELCNQEIGYRTKINQLLDDLLITVTRQLTRQHNPGRDFPKKILQLEQLLRHNLSHQWTVEEMAASVGMGTTLFNERVKNYSGFSPLTYLINIRISEAIRLLKKPDLNIAFIAIRTGFYSSQHFSTTFKKLTGYTPREFRKKNLPDE
jgi:AraC-like DNA-binding protein